MFLSHVNSNSTVQLSTHANMSYRRVKFARQALTVQIYNNGYRKQLQHQHQDVPSTRHIVPSEGVAVNKPSKTGILSTILAVALSVSEALPFVSSIQHNGILETLIRAHGNHVHSAED